MFPPFLTLTYPHPVFRLSMASITSLQRNRKKVGAMVSRFAPPCKKILQAATRTRQFCRAAACKPGSMPISHLFPGRNWQKNGRDETVRNGKGRKRKRNVKTREVRGDSRKIRWVGKKRRKEGNAKVRTAQIHSNVQTILEIVQLHMTTLP